MSEPIVATQSPAPEATRAQAAPTVAPPSAEPPRRPPSPRRWRSPGREAESRVLAAAGVAGVAAAAALTWDRPGVGWLGTAVVAAVATVWATWRRRAPETLGRRIERVAWALAALILLAGGAVHAAGWLFAFAVLTAAVAAMLALTGARTAAGLVLSILVWPAAAVLALPWTARGTARARSGSSAVRIGAAIAVGLVLLLIFGTLFASADAAFAHFVDAALPTVTATTVLRWLFGFGLVALGTLAGCYLAVAPPVLDGSGVLTRHLRRIEWTLPIGALVMLFSAFVTVQATVLFGGDDYVQRTAGLTYAEYARSGFWQLLAVTVLTLLVIGTAARFAPRDTRADRLWIRALLGSLALLALLVVASAIGRMWAYEQAYGFTRLRVLVMACEIWLGMVFVLILGAGIRLRNPARWLPNAVVATGVAALIALVGLNPDRFIAERNVDRFYAIGKVDHRYLSGLSADAVPALRRLPEPLRACVLQDIARDLAERPDEWRQWNLARHNARRLLAGYREPSSAALADCSAHS